MIFAAMAKLIDINSSFDLEFHLTEKNLYKSYIMQILETAKEDDVSEEVVHYLEKMKGRVQSHINKVKDGSANLEALNHLFDKDYREIDEIAHILPNEWHNHGLSYGHNEIVFITLSGYDQLCKMDLYYLLVFKVVNNSLYRFNNSYIGFSNKDIKPYTNFDLWKIGKMDNLEQCEDIDQLTKTFNSIKTYLLSIYRANDISELIENGKSYGLPSSSEVLSDFINKYNHKKNEMYLMTAGFHVITEDLLTLVALKRKYLYFKEENVRDIFGESYEEELSKVKEKLKEIIQSLQIDNKELIALEKTILKNERQ